MGWGECGFNCWGFKGPTLVLFLFYVNVSGICLRSLLPSQPLMIWLPSSPPLLLSTTPLSSSPEPAAI